MFSHETCVVDEDILNLRVLSQAFQQDAHLVAFGFECLADITRDVVLGMIAGDKHEGQQLDLFHPFPAFDPVDGVIKRRIAFDSRHSEVRMALGLKHVIEHGVLSRSGRVSTVANQ